MRLLFSLFLLIPSTLSYIGAVMGKLTACDDAKTGLEIDWNPTDFSVFTCPNPLRFARREVDPALYEMPDFHARKDVVYHKCVNEKLEYKERIPLRGDHRPNWAVFGEYLYLPVQRWLHNLEHGSIILLYHPCVDLFELQKLRTIVTGCLYRHVITPYNRLSEERPLALVAWGAKLELNIVDEHAEKVIVDFIRRHARVAPEDISRQGLYDQYLMIPSKIVTDIDDVKVCPNYPNQLS